MNSTLEQYVVFEQYFGSDRTLSIRSSTLIKYGAVPSIIYEQQYFTNSSILKHCKNNKRSKLYFENNTLKGYEEQQLESSTLISTFEVCSSSFKTMILIN